jgi:nucleoside-diphosphate-sugar epimerase
MMQNICVLGGTGFVGRGVIPALLSAGFEINALVRKNSEGKLPQSSACHAIIGEATNAEDIIRALEGCDALVNLVGTRRAEMKKSNLTYADVDLAATSAGIAAMRATKVSRLILLSAGHIGESAYVQTKKLAEQVVQNANVDWTILRPSYILGPGQMWPIIMNPVLSISTLVPGKLGRVAKLAQNVTRNNLADAIVWALGHPESVGIVFDVPAIRALAKTLGRPA